MSTRQSNLEQKEAEIATLNTKISISVVAIGKQNFCDIRKKNIFYVDKTHFIKEWWENKDDITLITRPRRFGKTLTLDMVYTFFSPNYAHRQDIFDGLSIWSENNIAIYREQFLLFFYLFLI